MMTWSLGVRHSWSGLSGFVLCLLALMLAAGARAVRAQAIPAGIGVGQRWVAGGTYSYFAADYGKRNIGGASGFVDYSRSPKVSYEAEVRFFTMNEEVGQRQSTYLVGAKFPYRKGHATFYGKVLIGDGHYHFAYDYADGNYFVLAPGGGVDVSLGHSRYSLRAVDFEYQNWLNFPFGVLRPYGVSSGFAVHFH